MDARRAGEPAASIASVPASHDARASSDADPRVQELVGGRRGAATTTTTHLSRRAAGQYVSVPVWARTFQMLRAFRASDALTDS